MFKSLLIAAGSVVCLGVVLQGRSEVPPPTQSQPLDKQAICAEGRVEGVTEEIELRLQLPGRLEVCSVTESQYVNSGDILLRIDDRQYRCATALAEAELSEAKGNLQRLVNGAHPRERQEAVADYQSIVAARDKAQTSWGRVERLTQTGAVTKEECEDRRAAVSVLNAQVESARARMERLMAPAREDEVAIAHARIAAAQARLDLSHDNLRRTELRAPIDGQILDVRVHCGELVGPDSRNPAIIIANTSRLRVRAWVEELDAPRVTVGAPVEFTVDGMAGRTYTGFVAEVSPRMSRKTMFVDEPRERIDTRTREIWIDIDKSEQLILGLSVDVTIHMRSEIEPN